MVGQNIGKYRVLDRVGRGGMGTVYRALDETLHREVAIKVLNAELDDPEVARRFRSEAITVARLNHPGIATIYELFQHDGQWLMVMEFLRGETLEHVVSHGGPLNPQRGAELCMQSLAALAHAHSMAVVHRDLKPANIMLTSTGDIKIMDFGIARVSGTEHLTNVGFMMGTPAYMAPEQVLGQEIDARADLYAMGVVLFRLITGHLPFKGDSPFAMAQAQVNATPMRASQFVIGLPSWVEATLERALAKRAEERFQSASEFHDTLERAIAGTPTPVTYRSSAPAGIVSTPPRAMPTGRVEAAPAVAAAAYDSGESSDLSGMAPTIAAPTPALLERPRTSTSPVPSAAKAPDPVLVQVDPPPPSRSRVPILAVAVGLVVVLGGGLAWMMTRPAPAPVEATAPAPVEASAPAPEPEAPAADEVAPVVPEANTPAQTTPRATSAVSAGRGASSVSPPAPAAIVDSHPPESIDNVRIMVMNGREAKDEQVALSLAEGRITAVGRTSGAVMNQMSYGDVTAMTYVHARSPRWDASLAGPPENLDVGGVFRSSRHWLTLQNASEFVIYRLEDINVIRVIRELEARTGVKVQRQNN